MHNTHTHAHTYAHEYIYDQSCADLAYDLAGTAGCGIHRNGHESKITQ